jgi:hypothetical protein
MRDPPRASPVAARRSIGRSRAVPSCALAVLLGACAAQPAVTSGEPSRGREAGRLLLLAAADGPVPLLVDQPPAALGPDDPLGEVARLAREGVREWAVVTFAPTLDQAVAADRTRLVLRFTELASGAPERVCAGAAPGGAPPQTPPRLQAVVCDGVRPVADAVGIAAGPGEEDTRRLIRRTTAALVPTHDRGGGFLPGVSIGVGVGGSSGGVGVGVGGIGIGF